MLNMLIVEDQLIQTQFLINTILKDISEIKIYNISTTGKDALNIINEESVDIILLDLNLPDMSGLDILEYLKVNKLNRYLNSILIITGDTTLIPKIIGNKYVFSYNIKGTNTENISKDINMLINEKKSNNKSQNIKNLIKQELKKLNYNSSYIGTKYLLDCIYESYKINEGTNLNLQKNIYPIIAKKYMTTINTVKSNINKSTSQMYFDCNESSLEEYLGFYLLNSKPKIKDIITKILNKIKK